MTETGAQRTMWSLAAVGDLLPAHNDWPCAARSGPGAGLWDCTRAAEHTGQHVATADRQVVAVWPSTPIPRPGSADRRQRFLGGAWI
jgi:hypothetical protein